jgi:hypothetical protein
MSELLSKLAKAPKTENDGSLAPPPAYYARVITMQRGGGVQRGGSTGMQMENKKSHGQVHTPPQGCIKQR